MDAEDNRELGRLKKDKKRAEKQTNMPELARLCNVLGELFARNDMFEDAITEHDLELSLCESLNDVMGTAIANRKIGECYCELGDFTKALDHQQRHLQIAKSCDDNVECQRALATIGRTYLYQVDDTNNNRDALRKAKRAFNDSLEMCERIAEKISAKEYGEMKCRLLLNLGLVYDYTDTDSALPYVEQASTLAAKHSLYEDVYRCQSCLAGMYKKTGQQGKAMKCIDEALKLSLKLKDKTLQLEAYSLKTQILIQKEDYVAAKKVIKKSIKLKANKEGKKALRKEYKHVSRLVKCKEDISKSGSCHSSVLLRLHEQMGDSLSYLRSYSLAIDNYKQMLEYADELSLSNTELIPIVVSLSQTYLDNKEYSSAIEYYHKELELRHADNEQKCRTWLNIAEAQDLDSEDHNIVLQSYKAAIICAKKADHHVLELRSLKNMSVYEVGHSIDSKKTKDVMNTLGDRYGIDLEEDLSDNETQVVDVSSSDAELSSSSDDEDAEETGLHLPSRTQKTVNRTAAIFCKKVNEKGETVLHRACIEGNLKKVQRLLDQSHPVNPRDNCGWIPLHEAANHGYIDIVKYLLDHGAHINDRGGERCEGVTPLIDACSCGNVDVIRLLIEKGASLEVKDDKGNTALMSLARFKNRSEAELNREEMSELSSLEKFIRSKMKGAAGLVTTSLRNNITENYDDLPEIQYISRRRETTHNVPCSSPAHSDSGDSDNIDGCQDPVPTDAPVHAYQEAMDIARNKKTRHKSRHVAMKEQPALISDHEYVEEWLEDDLGEPRSKRARTDPMDAVPSTSRATSSGQTRCNVKPTQSKKPIEIDILTESDSNEAADFATDFHPTETYEDNITQFSQDISSHRQTKTTKNKSRLRQSQLDFNVNRHNDDSLHRQNYINSTSNNNTRTDVVDRPFLRFRVKVLDKVLLVPISKENQHQTIAFLIKEVADRYNAICGLRPILTIRTQDGAVLSPADVIVTVMSQEDILMTDVEGWDLPPLTDRYIQACSASQSRAYQNIKAILQCSSTTNALHLEDLALRLKHLQPIVRAVQYESNLQQIYLQGNKLGDEGLKQVSKMLHTLPNITHLDVSCNGITCSGLQYVVDVLERQEPGQARPLQVLDKLNLSYNPLGDPCTVLLAKLLGHLPKLTHMGMSSCDVTLKMFQSNRLNLADSLKGGCLESLDISQNALGSIGVELLLSTLNTATTRRLDLSSTIKTNVANHITKHIQQFVQQGGRLETLKMNDCHLTSEHTPDLQRIIQQSKSLRCLKLSSNPHLKHTDISQLLQAASYPQCTLHELSFIGCTITGPLTTCSVLQCIQACVPINTLELSCKQCDKTDFEALTEIWKSKWQDNAIVQIERDIVRLAIADSS